jgi:hypothetical protein
MKLNPATILLDDYLEMMSLTSGLQTWDAEQFKDNPPRYYRVQRIQACMRALNIHTHQVHQFKSGGWCMPISEDLVQYIQSVLKVPFKLDYASYIDSHSRFTENYFFRMLLDMREIMSKYTHLQQAILAASGHFLTPVFMLNHLQEKQESEKKAIDEVLQLLMNPTELRLTREELIAQFDYPDVDLDEIDLEWI